MTYSEKLALQGWKTPDTYDLDFASIPETPGCYIILAIQIWPGLYGHHDEVAYIGMSEMLVNRIKRNHPAMLKIQRENLFAKRYFKEFPTNEIRTVEAALIMEHQPRFNIIGKQGAIQ